MIETVYRRIVTEIPTKEALADIERLSKVEARSMHGQLPVRWDKAEGFLVEDSLGNCWIDFTSTIFVSSVGHSNLHVVSAIKNSLGLLHTYTFIHKARIEFLEKLIAMTPSFCEKAFLLSSGTEATECAVKLMKMYGQKNDRKGIISFSGNMHGRTMYAEMMKGGEGSNWIGFKDPDLHIIDFPYPWESNSFAKDIEHIDMSKICGIMLEAYQGWGGIFYPKEYVQELVEYAHKNDILVTFDEIQSGFGRTGKLFAYQHYEVEPDLLCIGKAIGGGLPLSGVIGRKHILDLPEMGSMSSTHSANPLSCVAGLAVLEEIEKKNLVKLAEIKGLVLHSFLEALRIKYSAMIEHVCGAGLVGAIITKSEHIATRICEDAMKRGVLLIKTGRESIKIGPPLIIPIDALLEGLIVISECFEGIENA